MSEGKVLLVISMVHPIGKRPALQTLVPIVYRMADLQCPKNADASLTQHRSANLKNGILISTHYYVLLRISAHYYYGEALQQARDVQRPQHGVYVQTTTLRRQQRQLKARKVIASKLVEEVSNCFGEVAQLAVLAKQYLVGAYHLLPPQRRNAPQPIL